MSYTFDFELIFWMVIVLVGWGGVESYRHRRKLKQIPIRIHVNGTRGKSSVTRLIAAGFRQAGFRTCAKTTGTLPRFILPNGSEASIVRGAGANIIEQIRIVAAACALRAEVLVVECMALQPQLQWICEDKLIRATHGVLTNVRPDHLDVMGPSEGHVARALCGMIPPHRVVFSSEWQWRGVMAAACADRRSTLHTLEPQEQNALTDADMARFSYHEHRSNVALALRVLEHFGISRQVALAGMASVKPDVGALQTYFLDIHGKDIVFANGFAANDPVSTSHIWQAMCEKYHDADTYIALVNCRMDRCDRTRQLEQALLGWRKQPDYVALMGSDSVTLTRLAARHGFDTSRIILCDDVAPDKILQRLATPVHRRGLVIGIGNIAEPGLTLLQTCHRRQQCFE